MYTSRDRTGFGCQQSPERCYSDCRILSPSPCRTSCNHVCGCPVSIPHCPRKTVRFDHHYRPHLGRSRSVSRGGFHGTSYTDHSSLYRYGSPTLSRHTAGVVDDAKIVEHSDLHALLRRLSLLEIEMKGLLKGKSLKERMQLLGQKEEDDPPLSSPTRATCKDVGLMETDSLHCKCQYHVRPCVQAQKWQITPKETQSPLFHRKKESSLCEKEDIYPARVVDTHLQHTFEPKADDKRTCYPIIDPDCKEKKQIMQLWREYNCDVHLRRIIDGLRKDGAGRILDKVVHAQLTHNMLQYIAAVAKGLIGDEKTHYLSFFKREGPFRNKPLNEGTYGELLSFADKQATPAKDVLKALEVAEEGLEEEVGRAGYDTHAMGDIRGQMRMFLSAMAATSSSSFSPPLVGISCAEDDDAFFTREVLHDLIKAADQGKLGSLQNAQRLVKMACFLALKRLKSSTG